MGGISFQSIGYGTIALASLVLFIIYFYVFKNNRRPSVMCSLVAVTLIELGYFLLSVSKTLKMALFANQMSYMGNIININLVLVHIMRMCKIKRTRLFKVAIHLFGLLIFALVLTGGSSITWYYKNVSIVFDGQTTILVKEYGPLHNLYFFYILILFAVTIAVVTVCLLKKQIQSGVNPIILIFLATQNLFVWIIDRLTVLPFNLLSIAYVLSETMLLVICKNIEEQDNLQKQVDCLFAKKEGQSAEEIAIEWANKFGLTERETEILQLLMENKARSDIAAELYITESTVKKHTSHIYEKMNVKSRNELLHKLNEEIA